MVDDETRNDHEKEIVISQRDRIIDQLCGFHRSFDVRSLVFGGTDIILECRMCRGLYCSLANFKAHKGVSCRQTHVLTQYDSTNDLTYNEVVVVEPKAPEEGVGSLIRTSRPQQKSHSDRVRATLSQIHNGTLGRSRVYQWYTRIAEQINRQREISKTLCAVWTKIASNPNAVRVSYQEVDDRPDTHVDTRLSRDIDYGDLRHETVRKDAEPMIQKQKKSSRSKNGRKSQTRMKGGKKACFDSASAKAATIITPTKSAGSCSSTRSSCDSSPMSKPTVEEAAPRIETRRRAERAPSGGNPGQSDGQDTHDTRKRCGDVDAAAAPRVKRRQGPRHHGKDGCELQSEEVSALNQAAILSWQVKSNMPITDVSTGNKCCFC